MVFALVTMKLWMFSEYLATWLFCKVSSHRIFVVPLAQLSVLIFVVSARCVHGGLFPFWCWSVVFSCCVTFLLLAFMAIFYGVVFLLKFLLCLIRFLGVCVPKLGTKMLKVVLHVRFCIQYCDATSCTFIGFRYTERSKNVCTQGPLE